jgi:hypothetical protein
LRNIHIVVGYVDNNSPSLFIVPNPAAFFDWNKAEERRKQAEELDTESEFSVFTLPIADLPLESLEPLEHEQSDYRPCVAPVTCSDESLVEAIQRAWDAWSARYAPGEGLNIAVLNDRLLSLARWKPQT